MYSIVEIKGKQYQVEAGQELLVDRLSEAANEKVNGIKVLFYKDKSNQVKVGSPYLDKVKVSATILDQVKDKKVKVVHYKSKINYKKVHGHRQQYTKIKIDSIKEG